MNRPALAVSIIVLIVVLLGIIGNALSPPSGGEPFGDFGSAIIVSSAEVRIGFVGVFGDKDYSNYEIVIDPPGYGVDSGEIKGWQIDRGMTFAYNSTLTLTIVDSTDPQGISQGDYIEIRSTGQPLAPGRWELSLFHEGTDYGLSDVSFTIS